VSNQLIVEGFHTKQHGATMVTMKKKWSNNGSVLEECETQVATIGCRKQLLKLVRSIPENVRC